MRNVTLPAAASLAGYTLWLLAFPMGGFLLAQTGGPEALLYFLVPHVAALCACSLVPFGSFERWSGAGGALAIVVTVLFPLWPGHGPALLLAAGLLSAPVAVRAGLVLKRAPDPALQAALALVVANLLLAGLAALPLPRPARFAVVALALSAPCLMRTGEASPATQGEEEQGGGRGLRRVLPFLFVFHLVSGLFYGSLMPAYERVRLLPAVELLFYVLSVIAARRLVKRTTGGTLTCAILLGMLALGAFREGEAVRVHLAMFAMQASAGFMDLFVLVTLLRHPNPVRAFGLGLGTMCLGILGGHAASFFAGALEGGVAVMGSMALNLALLTLYWLGRRPLEASSAPAPAPPLPVGAPPPSPRLPPGLGARLSAMERSVLDMVVGGRTFKEAAAALAVSESSVKTYMKRIYEKTGVSGKGALLDKLSRSPAQGDPQGSRRAPKLPGAA